MPIHSLSQWFGLISGGLGFAGSTLLFAYSYALFPYEGAVWGSPETVEYNRLTVTKNRRAKAWQRTGFVLLCLAFVAQAISVIVP